MDLNNCSLSKIPSWVETCENLERIDISIDFSKFQKLEHLNLMYNKIKNIPQSLLDLPNLKSINLYGRKIPTKQLKQLKTNPIVQLFFFNEK